LEISRFDQLKFALAAYNDANRQANRAWAAAALLAVVVLASKIGAGDGSFLGLKLSGDYVLPVATIILSGFNISYAVAHASAYRVAEVYQSIVREHFSKEVPLTSKFSWFDLAMRAPVSSFSRLYPLFVPMERILGKKPYQFFKTAFDLSYTGFPAVSILYSMLTLPKTVPLYSLVLVVGAMALISTAFLLRWVIKWPRLASD